MFAIVNDLFKLEIGGSLKLLAGKDGLNKPINWFYVCQENLISPWVQGRELMILYGAGIHCDEDSLANIVKECANKKLSGIIVLVGHFITSVPEKMKKYADEYCIPLIEMPYSIPISKVTKQIADLIQTQNSHYHHVEDIMCDVIYGYDDNTAKLKNELNEAGYVWKKNNYIIIVTFNNEKIENIHRISAELCKRLGTGISIVQSNRAIILAGGNSSDYSEKVLKLCRCALDEMKEKENIFVSVGSHAKTAGQLQKSYINAIHVLTVQKSLENADVFSYTNMPVIYKLMYELKKEDVAKQFCNSILGDILAYDKKHDNNMLKTLEVYLLTGRNATESAERLYIHRNTMNYRIKQISQLTNKDLTKSEDIFELLTAIYIYKYIHLDNKRDFN